MNIGDRISVDKYIGTVKFVGNLPQWGPNALAYGIEWDDLSRGKNSGELDGTQYFTTSVAGAGLFIKASNKKIDTPVSFMDAINWRYCSDENEVVIDKAISFGSKTVEKYGFHKLNMIVKDVQSLDTVMLDKKRVKFAGQMESFPKTESMDLSYNLLTSWSELDRIIQHFTNLKSLNLNGNRFCGVSKLHLPTFLSELYLASTKVSVEQVNQIDLRNIRKLVVSSNGWTCEDAEKLNIQSLDILDLSDNLLEEIPALQRVTHLLLAGNNILEVTGPEMSTTTSLDLRYNRIATWDQIDVVGDIFPNLESLRINGCPVFSNITTEEMTVELIARLGDKISSLNGSKIDQEEIRDAELYFISQINMGAITFSNQRRWRDLTAKHRIYYHQKPVVADSEKVRLLVRLETSPETEIVSRVFLKNNTVLRVKGVVARIIGRSPLDLELFFVYEDHSRQYLHDDVAHLRSLFLSNNQTVYVSFSVA